MINRKALLKRLRAAMHEVRDAQSENRIRGKPLRPGSARHGSAISLAAREIGLLVAVDIVKGMPAADKGENTDA